MLYKCEMARLGYCNKTKDKHCNANDEELELCPYLKSIGEIAKMVAEQVKYEDDGK